MDDQNIKHIDRLGQQVELQISGAAGRASVTNVDAASSSVPVPLQRLAPFDYVLVDAPCTSVTLPDMGNGTMDRIRLPQNPVLLFFLFYIVAIFYTHIHRPMPKRTQIGPQCS